MVKEGSEMEGENWIRIDEKTLRGLISSIVITLKDKKINWMVPGSGAKTLLSYDSIPSAQRNFGKLADGLHAIDIRSL